MSAVIESPEIGRYLPHSGAMLLLDRIHAYDLEAGSLRSAVDIGADDLFYHAGLGGVPAWVGFEYMAQSIAALSGLHGRLSSGAEPKIGFIMSVRDFVTSVPVYAPGWTLDVSVDQIFRDGSLVAFECVIARNGEALSKAIVNAIELQPEELAAREAGQC